MTFPHCDPRILHAPGTCEFCDMHPEMQEQRNLCHVNFTGEYDPNKTICPAELKRPLKVMNLWPGNRQSTP